jgi:hypothetical protein
MVVKGEQKDAEHTCDPALKETVALIVKDTKPCPKCGERISKIDGCSQMWCIECHTAFDWTTGQQVNGVIHNPHYYEFLRKQGNGVAPRNAGDVPCGGVPYYHHLQAALKRAPLVKQTSIMNIHRLTQEMNDYYLPRYQGQFNANDNGDLGVLYLIKDIDKEQMKQELARREAKRNKHLAIRAILEMFVTTSTMMLNTIVSQTPTVDFDTLVTEYQNLRTYVNDSLMGVSRMKNCSVPQIGDNWRWIPYAKCAKKKRTVKKKEEEKDDSSSEEENPAQAT